jgi:hypothetical protein
MKDPHAEGEEGRARAEDNQCGRGPRRACMASMRWQRKRWSLDTDILGAVASTLLLYGSQRQALGNLSCYSERQLFKLWREYVI